MSPLKKRFYFYLRDRPINMMFSIVVIDKFWKTTPILVDRFISTRGLNACRLAPLFDGCYFMEFSFYSMSNVCLIQ